MSKDQLVVTGNPEEGVGRRYCEAVRRQIVAESYAPGASVSVVARRHDLNANLVFKWRQRYGRHDEVAGFLPVAVPEPAAIADVAPGGPTPKRRRVRKPASDGCFIEIELAGGHRVRVHGAADSRTVRSVIKALSR